LGGSDLPDGELGGFGDDSPAIYATDPTGKLTALTQSGTVKWASTTEHGPLTAAGATRQALERQRAGSQWSEGGWVFATEFGRPQDPRNALRPVQVAAKRLGFEGVGLHTLRHSAASVMLIAGMPLTTVSHVLGHTSPAETGSVYSHVSPDVAREALERLSAELGA
jgi:integrase